MADTGEEPRVWHLLFVCWAVCHRVIYSGLSDSVVFDLPSTRLALQQALQEVFESLEALLCNMWLLLRRGRSAPLLAWTLASPAEDSLDAYKALMEFLDIEKQLRLWLPGLAFTVRSGSSLAATSAASWFGLAR